MAMVLVAGSELFTGNNLIIISVLEKKVRVRDMLKNWIFVFLGNFLGATIFSASLPPYRPGVCPYTTSAATRDALSIWKMVILGFFAGVFIGFAGIASTTISATVDNASIARLLSACVFPAGMAMMLICGLPHETVCVRLLLLILL